MSVLKLPKSYKIRTDNAVTIPDEVLAFMKWGQGDGLTIEADTETGSVKLSKDIAPAEVKS